MPLRLQVESGGEFLIPFAKKKLKQWHAEMLQVGTKVLAREIVVTNGMWIFFNSISLGGGEFMDRIRITGRGGIYSLNSIHDTSPSRSIWFYPENDGYYIVNIGPGGLLGAAYASASVPINPRWEIRLSDGTVLLTITTTLLGVGFDAYSGTAAVYGHSPIPASFDAANSRIQLWHYIRGISSDPTTFFTVYVPPDTYVDYITPPDVNLSIYHGAGGSALHEQVRLKNNSNTIIANIASGVWPEIPLLTPPVLTMGDIVTITPFSPVRNGEDLGIFGDDIDIAHVDYTNLILGVYTIYGTVAQQALIHGEGRFRYAGGDNYTFIGWRSIARTIDIVDMLSKANLAALANINKLDFTAVSGGGYGVFSVTIDSQIGTSDNYIRTVTSKIVDPNEPTNIWFSLTGSVTRVTATANGETVIVDTFVNYPIAYDGAVGLLQPLPIDNRFITAVEISTKKGTRVTRVNSQGIGLNITVNDLNAMSKAEIAALIDPLILNQALALFWGPFGGADNSNVYVKYPSIRYPISVSTAQQEALTTPVTSKEMLTASIKIAAGI